MAFRASLAVGFATLLVGGVLFASTPASALTVAELQAQIQSLLSRIVNMQSGASVQTDSAVVVPSGVAQHRVCGVLYRGLSQGARGDDVLALQEFLQAQGYLYANPTGYFGPLTRAALTRWQASQGISAVGALGPLTRERIRIWCGSPSTGSGQGSGGGGVTQVDPSADPRCKAWYDGCNDCSREYPGGPTMCTLRACIWQAPAYCKEYFDSTANRPPVISSFSGPTVLSINQTGTWTVQASDPENGPLSYHVVWGDELYAAGMAGYAAEAFVQTTTFTHSYARAGTYTVIVHVRDVSGQQAETSATVRVEDTPQYCTMEYAPVCGQPPEPACRRTPPYCMLPTPGPQTYGNRCLMNAAGATFLYEGQCRSEPIACTADAMLCPDGTWVGRTGQSCEFVCPSTTY